MGTNQSKASNEQAPAQASSKAKKPSLYKRTQSLLAQFVGLSLIHLIGKTSRFVARDHEGKPFQWSQESRPQIYVLFHGAHFPILYYGRGRGTCVVTSRSADGQILTRVLHKLGYQTVRGSSSRGGVRATIELARKVREGFDVAVAVDGPKGPALKVKPGVVLLSKMTQCPIFPIAATSKTYWRFQSWDRFRLMFPFNKAVLVGGEPVQVPEDADDQQIERIRADLEQSMNKMQDELDAEAKSWIARLPDRNPRDKLYEKQRRQKEQPKPQLDTARQQDSKGT